MISRICIILILTTMFGCREVDPTIEYQSGVELEASFDYSSAIEAYLSAARKGHVLASFRLAQIYSGDFLTNEDGSAYSASYADTVRATYYYENTYSHLVSRDDQLGPDELAVLGLLKLHGNGTSQDEEFGSSALHDAAASGSTIAQYALGNYWYWIREETRDLSSAIMYLYQAAVQNHAEAQVALADLLMHQPSSLQFLDFNSPETWLRLAASNGSSAAKKHLASMTSQ